MNRKIVLLAAALLTASVCLAGTPRRSPNSPYQYGKRFYIALQGGPMTTLSENASSYSANDRTWDRAALHGQLSIGYSFTDAFDIRISGKLLRPDGNHLLWTMPVLRQRRHQRRTRLGVDGHPLKKLSAES